MLPVKKQKTLLKTIHLLPSPASHPIARGGKLSKLKQTEELRE